MKVIFGLYDNCYADTTSITYSVSHVIIHPEFQYPTRQNDLALLRLNSVVPFQKRISPVCLPTPGQLRIFFGSISFYKYFSLYSDMNYEHQVATVAAWYEGVTADNQSTSTCAPRKIDLPIIPPTSCTQPLIESQGCIGVVGSHSVLCRVR